MVMPGQVFVSWTACLRSLSAATSISAAFLRSASDIMAAKLSRGHVMAGLVPAIPFNSCRAYISEMPAPSAGMTMQLNPL
jgi:hypothetical protein